MSAHGSGPVEFGAGALGLGDQVGSGSAAAVSATEGVGDGLADERAGVGVFTFAARDPGSGGLPSEPLARQVVKVIRMARSGAATSARRRQ